MKEKNPAQNVIKYFEKAFFYWFQEQMWWHQQKSHDTIMFDELFIFILFDKL